MPTQNIIAAGKSNQNEFWVRDKTKIYLRKGDNNSTKAYQLPTQNTTSLSIGNQCIYVTGLHEGLFYIDKRTSVSQEIEIPATHQAWVKSHRTIVYTDLQEGVWLHNYSDNQLLYRNSSTQQWEVIRLNSKEHIQYNRISSISCMEDGNVWILTTHMGLLIYNTLNKSFTNLLHDPLKIHTIASNNLHTIHQDVSGTVFIGNFKHGVSYYSPMSQIILSNKSLEFEDILTFEKGSSPNYIYYGTDGGGLIHQSLSTGTYEKIDTPANVVIDLSMDSLNRLWIGTFQKGLLCYNNGIIKQYTKENSPLLENYVYTVEADKHGYIWIGTMSGHIQRLDPRTGKFDTILSRPGEFKIQDMYYDGDSQLYVAALGGLIIINTEEQTYNIYAEIGLFKENNMHTVYKDSRGLLWIGHPQGLSIWNQQDDSVQFISQKEGLAANLVRAIVEDNNNQMWIATGNGISHIQIMDKEGFSIANYSIKDGLICNETNIHAILKLDNGNILVGTPNGYETIIPQEFLISTYDTHIYLTDIELKSGTSYSHILPEGSLECTESLSFTEKENTFTLSFSALDLVETNKIKYAYKINNGAWINNGENNKISFSMLPAGNYTLSVKACNSQGTWSPHIKELKISILPPWWQTWWAYMIYLGIVTGIILLIVRNVRVHQKQKLIMRTIESENEEQRRLNNLKLQFFANISHELRTPLSLIINPLEEFFVDYPEHSKGMLQMVKQNAEYLLDLINKLLDFRKLDASAETLKCKHDNILIILNDTFHSFQPLAKKRNINYILQCQHHSIFMDFDYDKIRKICTNILSNAFKFTPGNGTISLNIEVKENRLEMAFSDTGCGVDDNAKEKIFQRFYQQEKNQSSDGGSGIGLNIVSEYVKMHQGTVTVTDNQPCGSIFLVTLPLHQNGAIEENDISSQEETIEELHDEEIHPFTILLVDDNTDFLGFLSKSLSRYYHVVKAGNGKQALNMLDKEDIDVIVSDIMMPEMDGLELCSFIKNDIRYSHIPIILLTAKASEEHQLEGLSVGADEYITKPFNMEVLKLRINKIIETSQRRQEIFSRDIKIEPSRLTITPLDQQLVEKAIQIVEEHIGEAEFSVEELANNLNISRSYFYKKLTKITGKKPIEFIRTIRLKRAQQLLTESQMLVSEIAYTLGYNSPKIFSKHFKEEFNITPTEFIRQNAPDKAGKEKEL